MNDHDLFERIQRLADEEHSLLQRGGEAGLSASERERLQSIEVHLDQCWDLLRQRRARRHAGLDPDAAQLRDQQTVERYEQ